MKGRFNRCRIVSSSGNPASAMFAFGGGDVCSSPIVDGPSLTTKSVLTVPAPKRTLGRPLAERIFGENRPAAVRRLCGALLV